MSNRFMDIAAPGVQGLKPYQPGKPIAELEREYGVSEIVKLASNENPLGPSPRALEALRNIPEELALYPDPNGFELKQRLARKHGVDPACITLGNGSNDVLVLLAEAFLTPAHEAVFSEYCFAVYPIATQAVGARARVAPAHATGHPMALGHDLNAMSERIGDATRLVFVANPNNPTGTWLEGAELKDFVDSVPRHALVVVDEAYIEYAEDADWPDASRWLAEFPNLVVTRTFSKAYGLAGLRVGYALSHPDVADLLNRVRQPFNVNSMALAAAEAALDDGEFLTRSRKENRAGMKLLEAELGRLGLNCVPSRGNFLLVDMGREAQELFDALLRNAVIVRPVANYGLPNHLRMTIGTESQNRHLLRALEHELQ